MKKKTRVKNRAFNFLGSFGSKKSSKASNTKIRTKFNNICGKTGQYDVPAELFQRRTSRQNRALISWKAVKKNNLSLKQLETFTGGVTVEFINEDFFLEENQNNPLFCDLVKLLGSDSLVSSIITIRSETGSSSSAIQRENFLKLINNTTVEYKGRTVTVHEGNYQDYAIRQTKSGGKGNEKWEGFLFVSIKGGQHDSIETHKGINHTIFNPACEFANRDVCLDIDLVMSYFALISVPTESLDLLQKKEFEQLFEEVRDVLESSYYEHGDFSGSLLDYCDNHPSTKMVNGKLYDTVQVQEIFITDFDIDDKNDLKNLDFTHNEAVNRDLYYWDTEKHCILTPARPTNVFWSKHLSNMMQQNFTLEEYYKHEEEIVERRRNLLNLHKKNDCVEN